MNFQETTDTKIVDTGAGCKVIVEMKGPYIWKKHYRLYVTLIPWGDKGKKTKKVLHGTYELVKKAFCHYDESDADVVRFEHCKNKY